MFLMYGRVFCSPVISGSKKCVKYRGFPSKCITGIFFSFLHKKSIFTLPTIHLIKVKKIHCRSSLYFLLVELDFSYAYFNSVTFCVDFLCLWSSIYNVSLSQTFTFVKSKAVNSRPNYGDFQVWMYFEW